MLAQRRRRWADVAQMLYKCFVFAVCDQANFIAVQYPTLSNNGLEKNTYFSGENHST